MVEILAFESMGKNQLVRKSKKRRKERKKRNRGAKMRRKKS